jgi:UDP-glucose 4-epimerase
VIDLAEAHRLGLAYIRETGRSDLFNLGSGTGFTVLEMITRLDAIIGDRVQYVVTGRREGDPAVLVASNEKAKSVLGWNPANSDIEMILTDAYRWERNRTY